MKNLVTDLFVLNNESETCFQLEDISLKSYVLLVKMSLVVQ